MAEFSTEAVFEARVSQRSLRKARQTVEDELGDVEIGVGGGGAGRSARADRVIDEFEVEHDLSRERNLLLEQLLEEQEKDAFNRALKGGGGMAALGGAGILAGLTLGGGLISFLQEFEFEPPDIPPLEVPKPDWVPIPVGQPSGTPSSEQTGAQDVPPNPFIQPDPATVIGGAAVAGGAAAAARAAARGRGGAAGSAAGVAAGAPAQVAARAARGSQTKSRDQQTILERLFGDMFRDAGLGGGSAPMASAGLGLGMNAQRMVERSGVGQNRAGTRQQVQTGDTNVDVTVEAKGATQRDVEQAMDDAKRETLEEFNRRFSGRGGRGGIR